MSNRNRSVAIARAASALLSMTLLSAVDAADEAPLCRIKIGDDWVTMGAESQASCLKFAQSAALPDERQLSEFAGRLFAYDKGVAFTSDDGGNTWVALPADADAADEMQSLNVLRKPGRAAPAAPASNAAPKLAAARASIEATPAAMPSAVGPAAAASSAPGSTAASMTASTVTAPTQPPATATTQATAASTDAASAVIAAATAATTATAPVAETAPAPTTVIAVPPAVSTADVDIDPAPGFVASLLDPIVSRDPVGCQVKAGGDWSTSFTRHLSSCALQLIEAAQQSSTAGNHAYWSGHYLFYAKPRLYHSTDSANWQVVDYQLTAAD